MFNLLLDHPEPNFAALELVLKGEQEPRRVHLVELGFDEEVLQVINERYLSRPWIPLPPWFGSTESLQPACFENLVAIYHSLGHDFVPIWPVWPEHPTPRRRFTEDTAQLNRGQRAWVEVNSGHIASWEDFERFPWDKIRGDPAPAKFVAKNLPSGMKMTVTSTLFEHVGENLVGYARLFYMLHDEPELVARIFDSWGQKVYDFYESVVGMDELGAIFHADDLGYRTSTMVSPHILRQLVFPWLRRFAELAHQHGKMFWLHSCGNLYQSGVIEDLIRDVQIDALHSFQDTILPVTDFKTRYGDRVAALGGLDVDKLSRLDEASLRRYIRDVVERCTPGGRFALGSGNTVTNYIPVESYSIVVEEARGWQPPHRAM